MGADRPRLLAVTILTSMDQKTMKEVGINGAPKLRVVKLAQLAKKVGVDGVVASVQEARAIRKACGREFLIVTPVFARKIPKSNPNQKINPARLHQPKRFAPAPTSW